MKSFKFFMSLFVALLFNVVMGGVMASVTGFSPEAMVGLTTFGSIAMSFTPLRGVLPMAVSITSIYAGEVLDQLLTKATTGNQIVSGGHIRVVPNVTKKFAIPRLRAGRMLQKRKETPTSSDSKGDFTIDEKYLEPQDVMAYTEFNPRAFESFWRAYQPTGNLVFSELPANVQGALLTELAKVVDFELGNEFINGVKGVSEGQYFDGILTRVAASATVVKIASPVAIVDGNVIDKMKLVRAAIPKPIKNNPNLKMFMSQEDFDMYENYLTLQPSKGKDYTDMNPERFKGIRVVVLADWPKDTIVAAVSSMGLDSNFWAGVSLVDDTEAILIDKISNASEKYFFKMLMKADTNIVFDEDIVLYDGRAAAIIAGDSTLSALELSAGAIVPEFDPEVLAYTIAVANNVATTTVTATKGQNGQVIKLGSTTLTSAVASAARNLAVGENIITVAVTSADGLATTNYQVLVTRAAS